VRREDLPALKVEPCPDLPEATGPGYEREGSFDLGLGVARVEGAATAALEHGYYRSVT
jgi:hypothetical protein